MFEYLNYLPVVMIGYYCADGQWFEKVNVILKHNIIFKKFDKTYVYILSILSVVLARGIIKSIGLLNMDVVYVLVLIFLLWEIFNRFKYQKIYLLFEKLGTISLEIWFLHAVFFVEGGYKIQTIAYWPRLDILILIWVIIFLIPFAIMIRRIKKSVQGIMQIKAN